LGSYGIEQQRIQMGPPPVMRQRGSANMALRTLPMSAEDKRSQRIEAQEKFPKLYTRLLHGRELVDTDMSSSAKFNLKKSPSVKVNVHRNKKYKCSVCGEAYGLKKTKERHETDKHKLGVMHLCYCGMLIGSSHKYRRHLLSMEGTRFHNFDIDIINMRRTGIINDDYRLAHHRSVQVNVHGVEDTRFVFAPEHNVTTFYRFYVANASAIYRGQLFVRNTQEYVVDEEQIED